MKGLIARADGTRQVVEIFDGTLLYEAQHVVGGFIEVVNVPTPIGDLTVFVNDNGIAEGLPLNLFATELCAHRGWTDPIVGDILVMGGADWDGGTLPLSELQAAILYTVAVTQPA